jgi:hypothetical protein
MSLGYESPADWSREPLKLTSGQKSAPTRKWRRAASLAHKRSQNAKTFAKYELSRKDYRCISFDSKRGYEYKGIVDVVAIKRYKKTWNSLIATNWKRY